LFFFFFSSRRRHTRFSRDWSSDVCSSDLKFTADGNTDMFYLTHRPVSVYAVRIDGMYKKTGHVGKQFFFLGYEALIDEYTKTLSFAAPPPNTGKQDKIEIVYSYVPVY